MALTNLQRFRQLKINDNYKGFVQSFLADGETQVFDLSYYPVKASGYTGYVDGIVQHETADYSLSPDDGRATFVNAPANGASIRFVGQYSTFSDTELAEFMSPIATGATAASLTDLDTPTIACIETLMSDAWKRHNWAAAGGQSVSEDGLFSKLIQWRKMILDKQTVEQGPDGAINSWAEEQANYPGGYE
jgi:hypothetical protein